MKMPLITKPHEEKAIIIAPIKALFTIYFSFSPFPYLFHLLILIYPLVVSAVVQSHQNIALG
jgi:hypothetical protein